MLHRVNKLQFEASCATEANAFEVQHSFSQKYQAQITEVIDKVCSRYVSEDEWIHIDSIEVDLGNFNIQSFEKIFTGNFLTKFEKEFAKKINSIPVAEKQSSKKYSYLEILVYFLQTGTLPWWADGETLNINTIFTEVAEQQRQRLYNFLEQQKFTDTLWQRIAMQFNYQVHNLVVSFFSELVIAKNKLLQWYSFIKEQTGNTRYEINSDQAALIQLHKFILFHATVFFKSAKVNIAAEPVIHLYTSEFIRIANINISAVEVAEKIITYEKTMPAQAGIDTATIEQREEPIEVIKSEVGVAEKFTVHTAGAVLLGPYFKQLFTHLNLLEQGKWKHREAQYKAVHLIRYLVTGQQMCPEHSLVMEKLLCGLHISMPIPREIELSEEETDEAKELLQSVISNWAKLKNTSVEGLRETFLKRDGILTKKENGWLVRVERKTHDILLESIPWGYSTLAFTWSNYIIFTEW